MTEVARIAVYRGIGQSQLAELYSKATRTDLQSCHVKRHFEAKATQERVREGYAKALGMSNEYVRLLLEPGVPYRRPPKRKPSVLEAAILDPLRDLELVEPLFEKGALGDALQVMLADETLRDQCRYAAELANERWRLMPGSEWIPTLPIEPDAMLASNVPENYVVPWAAVANVLRERRGFDLASKVRQKDARRIRREELLSLIWDNLYGALHDFDSAEFREGKIDFAPLDWDEWLAVEHLLKLIFGHRRWPVDKMVERLHAHPVWPDFEMNDPSRQSEFWSEAREAFPEQHVQ